MRVPRGVATRTSIVIGIVLLGLITILATRANEWTYHVEASTWGGSLTFDGEGNDWLILQGTICPARAVPDLRNADPEDESSCPAARFEVPREIQSDVIHWREGTRIHFRRAQDGRLIIRTLNDSTDGLPTGSRLEIPSAVWQRHGALIFSGSVRIGGDMGTGAQDYLIGGRWEARQMGLATSLFREITEVVQRGDLSRGASVQVVGHADPAISYGHLTPAATDEPGLEVVSLSERGRLSLQVQYFGLSKPSLFRPDWMDTISSSPMLFALAILLTFILSVVQLVIAVAAGGRDNRD